jgi:hypothetical protein
MVNLVTCELQKGIHTDGVRGTGADVFQSLIQLDEAATIRRTW